MATEIVKAWLSSQSSSMSGPTAEIEIPKVFKAVLEAINTELNK